MCLSIKLHCSGADQLCVPCCILVLQLVAPNATAYNAPEAAGLPMGTPDSQVLSLELHYNNPEGLQGERAGRCGYKKAAYASLFCSGSKGTAQSVCTTTVMARPASFVRTAAFALVGAAEQQHL